MDDRQWTVAGEVFHSVGGQTVNEGGTHIRLFVVTVQSCIQTVVFVIVRSVLFPQAVKLA